MSRAIIAARPGGLGAHLVSALQQRGQEARLIAAGETVAAAEPAAALLLFADDTRGARPERLAAELQALVRSARGADVGRIVYWSSAAAYAGSSPGSPCGEEHPLDAAAVGTALEQAVREAAGDHPGLFVFRAVSVVGLAGDWVGRAGAARALPMWPDAVIQLLHVGDVVDILLRALQGGHPGTYNVAGDGLLRWSHALRALRIRALACPRSLAAAWLQRSLGSAELVAQLRHGTVIDTARLKTHFGYRPRFAARDSLARARDMAAGGSA